MRPVVVPERVRQALPIAIGLAVFLAAIEVLRVELRAVTWHQLAADVVATPIPRLGVALGLTVLNYVALAAYDLLAFAYVGRPARRAQVAVASFLAYAISNSVGFAMLSGASVRYRFYTRWGVTAEELSRIVVANAVTLWLGLLALGGLSVIATPVVGMVAVPAAGLLAPLGWLLMLAPATYLALTVVWKTPICVGPITFPLPRPRIAIGQLLISTADWLLAGAALYVLLPPGGIGPLEFLGAFLVAMLLGMVSHVPGGIGVFEGLMVLQLEPYLPSAQLVPALVVYRAVYYLLPLAVAALGLAADEIWQRRMHVARAGAALGRLTEQLTPRVLAAVTFLAGLVLLFSGATPAAAGRLELIDRLLPIGVIETSHFAGSIAGVALLVLSQGLARRLDAAYVLTACAIVTGMVASLLKGFDYEEAGFLLLVLLVLWRSRPAFSRRAALFDTRFSPGWIGAVCGALGSSWWLGLFAFKHVDYSHQLWWQFELHGEAPRFLRASVGAALALLLVGLTRLLGPRPHEAPVPDEADLDDAGPAIAAQTSTYPFLVYLRDKALLFDEARTAFVMYGVRGRTWVALGDPVGPEHRIAPLIRGFLERCDDFAGVPVFYQIARHHLHRYADLGLTFVKLGEEARVDLRAFTLEGPRAARHRQTIRRFERDGSTFRVVEPADVPALLPQLREVSDDWLVAKASAEKGFSLGFFDDRYVERFPVAVVEGDGRVEAFATIWPGPGGVELSVDLMRYRHDAPRSVMEALFVHLMRWGHERGYAWFALGMAPLSGVEPSPIHSLWTRIGGFLYEHGEAFYHFQGLRAFKEKFDPVWAPRYLAYPGGLRLPRVLADVSALVAGGYWQIFRK
jgi:phosphatidylglycerol lysyltransferase